MAMHNIIDYQYRRDREKALEEITKYLSERLTQEQIYKFEVKINLLIKNSEYSHKQKLALIDFLKRKYEITKGNVQLAKNLLQLSAKNPPVKLIGSVSDKEFDLQLAIMDQSYDMGFSKAVNLIIKLS